MSETNSNPKVLMKVQINNGISKKKGEILIELFQSAAHETVKNFLRYVDSEFYNGTIFHRVINGFMIQGGGMLSGMLERDDTFAPIKNEAANGLKNEIGTIAMARTNDINSATSQFFINVADNDFLNHKDITPQGFGYAVFGKVVKGMKVVDEIKEVSTGETGFHQDVPRHEVVITEVCRV